MQQRNQFQITLCTTLFECVYSQLRRKLKYKKEVPDVSIIKGFIFEHAVFNDVKQKRCLSVYKIDADEY